MTPADPPPPLVPRWLIALIALSAFALLLSLGLCGVSVGASWPSAMTDLQGGLALGSIPAMFGSLTCFLVSVGVAFVFLIVRLARRR